MKIVKLTFNFDFPIFRQSPGYLGIWGDYKFIIDESLLECDYWLIYSDHKLILQKCKCPKENIYFIPAEGHNTSVKYPQKFLDQFGKIITVQKHIIGGNVIYHQNANPWFINKTYDELIKLTIPQKTKLISIVTSNKQNTIGHRKRLEFSIKLKNYFGDRADLYGRGIRDFEDKWEVLAPYKYTVAIENDLLEDWMTEKIIDPILTFTMPFYYGCPNINKYLNPSSYLNIDIDDFEGSVKLIEEAISNDFYSRFMINAKEDILQILNTLQLFPMVTNFFQNNNLNFDKCENTIYPIEYFDNSFKTKYISKMTKKIINLKNYLFTKITKNELIKQKRCIPWFEINGDLTLRLDYELNENSIIFDIGGYKGDFARDIFCKYSCFIYIFEPIKEYHDIIINKFKNNKKVKVYPFALGMNNTTEFISLDQNSSSLFTKSKNKSLIEIKSINDFIEEHKFSKIDLMKINIEGSEYDLMESLILKKNHLLVDNFQIQFHDFVIENAKERMKNIQLDLSKSHTTTYKYEFVWENWKKNNL